MNKVYLITKYTYKTGSHETVAAETDKSNALNILQSYAINYIQNQDGVTKIVADAPKITDIDSLEQYVLSNKSLKLDYMSPNRIKKILSVKPIGHYIIVDTDDHYHKWSIWQRSNVKQVAHRFLYKYEYEVPHVCKILDLDIVEYDSSKITLTQNILDEKIADSTEILIAKKRWGDFSSNFASSPTAISKNVDTDKK